MLKILSLSARAVFQTLENGSTALKFTPTACIAWVRAARNAFPKLCMMVLRSQAASLAALSNLAKTHLPSCDHYFNDNQCSKQLVTQRLVNWNPATKQVLVDESVLLYKAVKAASFFRERYGLLPPEGPQTEITEQISEAMCLFQKAKSIMDVASAAHCWISMTGPEQIKAASERISPAKVGLIPKALARELQQMLLTMGR